MYLMVGTRPNFSFPVCNLVKFVQDPTLVHWDDVKRMLMYIIAVWNMGLSFGGYNASLVPLMCVDADWIGGVQMRKSMSACAVIMGDVAVSWCTRQQEVLVMSCSGAG